MKFAEVLKNLRKERHMTQEELSALLNVAKSTVSMYEQGERMPNLEMLESIADIFNVSIDFLFGRQDGPNLQELKIAVFNGNSEVTDSMWDKLLEYAKLLNLEQEMNKKGE